jgi:hypothetical protein
MVRPERFELPAFWFVARRSIQLSYGRIAFQQLTADLVFASTATFRAFEMRSYGLRDFLFTFTQQRGESGKEAS